MGKKTGTLLVSSILSVVLLLNTGAVYANTSQDGAQHEVIITYNNNQGKEAILEDSVEVQHVFQTIPAVSATVTSADLKELIDDPNIAYIERNVPFTITAEEVTTASESVATIPAEQSQWGFQAVKPTNMWSKGYTGTGVKVAVIDSGLYAHPELLIAGGISTVDYTTSYTDDNGHGTHVAGIIAAKSNNGGMVGIAPDVQLYAVKSMDANGDGNLQDVLEGIDWAIQNQMDIINLSLGTAYSSNSLKDIVDQAYAAGIIIVASAGNSGAGTNTITYPAKYDSVIAVSAMDVNQARGDFSSTGPENELSAPGVGIISTAPGGGYAKTSGTSQAAPHITGMLALLKQEHPLFSNEQQREEIRRYAIDLGAPGRDDEFGYGFVTFAKEFDVTAPAEISDLTVSEVTANTATVTWINPQDADFAKVNLYANEVFAGEGSGTTYTFTGLTPHTVYNLQAKTVDTTGNVSAGQNVVTATLAEVPPVIDTTTPTEPPVDLTAPAEVSTLGVTDATYASIQLHWTNPLDTDFAKVEILVNGEFVDETTRAEYNLTGLTSDTVYNIVIKTLDSTGNSSVGAKLQAKTLAAVPLVTAPDPVIPNPLPDIPSLPTNITLPPTGGSAVIVPLDAQVTELKEAKASLDQAKTSLTMISYIEAKHDINALSDADKRNQFQQELDHLKLELDAKALLTKNEVRPSVPINVSVQAAMKSEIYKYIDLSSIKPGENVFVVDSKGEVVTDLQVYVLWNRIFVKPASGSFISKETYTLIIDKTVKGKPAMNSSQSYSLSNPLTLEFTTR
ncbi:S8 family serine peptidase [Paenibacillus wynnii]|uniref:S8 family serine peptidase n=1 Tax=Paenibacillus wynnii TaxID=268407 RepID=UPI002791DA2A|nr:S8 family serine peptidase [Paenibacillus wynnii]MDQ0195861.1 subtilisin family serine protease [Paenibacillus wynnii]